MEGMKNRRKAKIEIIDIVDNSLDDCSGSGNEGQQTVTRNVFRGSKYGDFMLQPEVEWFEFDEGNVSEALTAKSTVQLRAPFQTVQMDLSRPHDHSYAKPAIHIDQVPDDDDDCSRSSGQSTVMKDVTNENSELQKIARFRCNYCTKSFDFCPEFKKHLAVHHDRAPTCSICQKVFAKKNNLKIHMRIHTGEKPYKCSVCDKEYSDRSNYNAHLRKHRHRPFNCLLCKQIFLSHSQAHNHVLNSHFLEYSEGFITKVVFQ